MSLPSQPTTILPRHQSGFAFIEVLISIVILGMLMSAATPLMVSWLWTSQIIKANMEVSRIEMASTYYTTSHNGTFAQNLSDLQPLITGPLVGTYTLSGNVLVGDNFTGLRWNAEREQWAR